MARDLMWKRVALMLLLTGCGSEGPTYPPASGSTGGGGGGGGGGSSGGGTQGGGTSLPTEVGAANSLEWREAYSSIDESFDTLDDVVRWRPSDKWANGNDFDAGWRADHVRIVDGRLALVLDDETCATGGCYGRHYASGELTTRYFHGFGRYEVRLKPPRAVGTMTAFSITTGSADATRSDSIDLAILGQNTRSLRVNYIANGGVRHDLGIALPFDAAEDFHTFGIEWTRTAIHWYADGKRVHSEGGNGVELPTQPGRILVNFWPGLPVLTQSWMGRFVYPGTPLVALVDSVRHGPAAPVEPLEDFETPEKAALWKSTIGTGTKLTARQSNQGHQGKSLYMQYTTSPSGRVFAARAFATPQDWTGARYVNFWFKGNQTGDAFRLELRDNGPSADAAERFEYLFQDDFKGWKWVSAPLTAFKRSPDGQPAGAPQDGLTLSAVWGVGLEPLSGSAHEIFLDDMELER